MQKQINKPGTLYVVATPIGNLQDISLRAIDVLKKVDRIVSEDTRHTARLLNHFSIKKPTTSLHEFNEKSRVTSLLELLDSGEDLALVSDAGTPLISDPGFELVRQAKLKEISVVPIPGACALIAALSAAGIRCDKLIFEGFLPAKTGTRQTQLQRLKNEERTMIFYEAPHRLQATLQDLSDVFGVEREAAVARELTKIHETILLKNLADLCKYFADHPLEIRGEIVIIVSGTENQAEFKTIDPISVLEILLESLSLKKAVEVASKITHERKNILYQAALKLQKKS